MRSSLAGILAIVVARTPEIVTVLTLAGAVLSGCAAQMSESGNAGQRARFYSDPPDPYHYRQPFQAG